MSKVINIQKANYVDDYKIHFEFDDGVETTYNAPKNQDNFSNNLISSSPVTLCCIF